MWAYRGEYTVVGSDGVAHQVRLWVAADTGQVTREMVEEARDDADSPDRHAVAIARDGDGPAGA